VDLCHSSKLLSTTFTDSKVNNKYCFRKYHTSEKHSAKNYFICGNEKEKGTGAGAGTGQRHGLQNNVALR